MKFLQDNWQIITAVVGLVFSTGIAYATLSDLSRRVTTLEQVVLVMPQLNAKLDQLLAR